MYIAEKKIPFLSFRLSIKGMRLGESFSSAWYAVLPEDTLQHFLKKQNKNMKGLMYQQSISL